MKRAVNERNAELRVAQMVLEDQCAHVWEFSPFQSTGVATPSTAKIGKSVYLTNS